jgi:hypothetical protein
MVRLNDDNDDENDAGTKEKGFVFLPSAEVGQIVDC